MSLRRVTHFGASLALTIVLGGCPGDDAPVSDSGPPPDVGDSSPDTDADASAIGGTPTFTPCPDGWREVTDARGVVTCDPWPETGFERCPAGQAHFPGEPGCTRLGSECPIGGWAIDLPTDRTIVYVRPGAGGDGTMASPFATIAEGIAAAPAGAIVALARGDYREQLTLDTGVTLWGACVDDTTIEFPGTDESDAIITVDATGATVRNLTLRGLGDIDGIEVGGMVDVRDTAFDRCHYGILAVGGQAVAENVLFTRSENDGVSTLGGRVIVRRGVFVDGGFGGISINGGSAELEDVAIFDSAVSLPIFVGELVARRLVVEGSSAAAITAIRADLTLEGAVLRRTFTGAASGHDGVGLYLTNGSTASLDRVLVEETLDFGIGAYGEDTRVTATNVVVREVSEEQCAGTTCADGSGGMSVVVADSAEMTLERFLLTRAQVCGVMLAGGGALDLANGEVSESEIGACIQVDDYDPTRLSESVEYRDNGINLDATSLPVPAYDAGP